MWKTSLLQQQCLRDDTETAIRSCQRVVGTKSGGFAFGRMLKYVGICQCVVPFFEQLKLKQAWLEGHAILIALRA
jgi:hypothetical protein